MMHAARLSLAAVVLLLVCAAPVAAQPAETLHILFLGDEGPHRPAERFKDLRPALARRGIDLEYSGRVDDLNLDTLAKYSGLMLYANIDSITAGQEAALLEYVESGHGFIPLHCASYCFRNSRKYIELVGAQFQRHGTGTFRTALLQPEHPLLKGFRGFESWDETYIHTQHNEQDRTVLEVRREGGRDEPWTWVRRQGKGRVFYTAWGHDDRTWTHPGFHNLVERGVRWAVGSDPGVVPAYADRPEMTPLPADLKPFEYVEARVPFYPAGERWGTIGEPLTKMQKPLPPEESIRHFVTPVGFQVELFASEPQLQGKPIAMNWDDRGRCWVCETVDYPNELQPEGQGRDRIRICEDVDGDGRADRFTVFAENLSIPTGLTFSRGGVIVLQAPHTLFLKDTNGDDVADERRILFTGWSTSDTHAGPSNLVYGPDNWIYGIVGYSGFEGEVGGEQHSFRQGFFRFRPDGSKLEFLRNTNNNSWGVGFSEEGVLFGSTANGNPSVYMPIPNRHYEQVRGWSASVLGSIAADAHYEPITRNVRQVDHHGNFTAAAGHALYTARAYPAEYWNRTAFVADPTGHLVSTFVITPQGADFRSRYGWNLLASDDEWSSPVMAEVGPDGQVWVIDWYNYIVQHNPTPAGYTTGKGKAYETDLRDKTRGRIYRVVWKSAPAAGRLSLGNASPEALVAALNDGNLLWRRHAQRLLVERGQVDVVPALEAIVRASAANPQAEPAGAVHALHTLHGLQEARPVAGGMSRPAVSRETFEIALAHRSAAVRRAAVTTLPRETASLPWLIGAEGAIRDADAQVRLATLLAVAEIPISPNDPGRLAADLLSAAKDNADPWIADALVAAAARHDAHILRTLDVLGDTLSPAQDALVQRVAEHFTRRSPGSEDVTRVLVDLAQAPRPAAEAVIAGFLKGWPRGQSHRLSGPAEQALVTLFRNGTPTARSQLAGLTARMGSKVLEAYAEEIAAGFLDQAKNEQAADAARTAAARQLIEFRKSDSAAVKQLLELMTPRTSPELARGLIEACARSEADAAARLLLDQMRSLTPALRPAVVRALLSRAAWTAALLDALESGEIQPGDLALDQKQALASHPDPKLATRAQALLSQIGALPSPDRQKVYDQLVSITKTTGDARAGRELFRKHCAKCHIHGTEGTRIGPDLTGMAVHPKSELLINVLDPSRSVEGNFRMYNVSTVSGTVITGMLLSESRTAIELIDSDAKKQVVLRDDIDELVASTKSLMPEGFEKQMTAQELTHLLEFLAERGRYLPVPLAKSATISTVRGMFYSEEADAERLIFNNWQPREFAGVPFVLVDPQQGRTPNAILLHGPNGKFPPTMPRSVTVPCNAPAAAVHLLSGVSGWGFPLGEKGSVSMIVRLHYADGHKEDHPLKNGEHFADYIRRVDVPGSTFAFALREQQIRYLAITPGRPDVISKIEFVKGPDATAPVVMAVTIETRQ